MAWTIRLLESAKRDLAKLDRKTAQRIRNYLVRQIAPLEDPRSRGRGLKGPLSGHWRYRVGDYRIVCSIDDREIVIIVIEIDHRSNIYR